MIKVRQLLFTKTPHPPSSAPNTAITLKSNDFYKNKHTLAFKSLKLMYHETRNQRPGGITGQRKKRE